MNGLISKIENGAKLLITYDGRHIAPFEKLTGFAVKGREACPIVRRFELCGKEISVTGDSHLII